MENSYNVRALLDMAQEYLNAENEYRVFLLTFKGGWVPSMKPEEYGDYCKKEAASNYTYDALRNACKIISADMATVLATAKAINRYEKRERWQVCAHIPGTCYGEERVRRFFSEGDGWAGHYHSTGRRKAWAA